MSESTQTIFGDVKADARADPKRYYLLGFIIFSILATVAFFAVVLELYGAGTPSNLLLAGIGFQIIFAIIAFVVAMIGLTQKDACTK